MSETVLTIEDAAARLGELVEQVHYSREPAIITRSGQPLVRIVPILSKAETADDLIDFLRRWQSQYPAPDEQFMDAIQVHRQTNLPPRNPWD